MIQQFSFGYLQIGNDPLSLIEWFVASGALVILVTLIYIFVLNKSPPPEGSTEAKLEQSLIGPDQIDTSAILRDAHNALRSSDLARAVELSIRAATVTLSRILRAKGVDHSDMNISDMAYIVQTKSPGSSDITQPVYQLNLLHLKVAQSEHITSAEAEWAINTAAWLSQLALNSQIG